MMEIAQLAAEAVKALAVAMAMPAAKLMAGKAEEGFAGEAGKKLLTWLTGKMSAPVPKAVLERAVAEPDEDNLNAVQGEIASMARKDPDFRRELEEYLSAGGVHIDARSQNAVATGDNNTQVQIMGSGNIVR